MATTTPTPATASQAQRRNRALQRWSPLPEKRLSLASSNFEQISKRLTGLPIGGGKGGSDFDPTGKSDAEISVSARATCRHYIVTLVPLSTYRLATWALAAAKSASSGEYRRLKGNLENGVLTKLQLWWFPHSSGSNGLQVRYDTENVLRDDGQDIKGKTIAAAGFGNVTWGICKKAAELGAKVVTPVLMDTSMIPMA